FMFPKRSVIRYDFPARGSMGPVKLFWHDGCTETPEIPGVPKGELLGDLPIWPYRRPAARSEGGAPPLRPRVEPNGFIGPVFNWERYQALLNDPEVLPDKPNGSAFIGDKGII